jgi:iron complex outermembrane recepter protein
VSSPEMDLSGNNLSRSPDLTANVSATFGYPLADGELTGSANFYHSGRIYFDPANLYSQDPFNVINARIGYRWKNGFEMSAWSRNLSNTAYYTTIVPTQLGASNQYGQPRTVGITLRYSFAN